LLSTLGWNTYFASQAQELSCDLTHFGRVAAEHNALYQLYTESGDDIWAAVSGKWRHGARNRSDFPAVGDFVAYTVNPGDERATMQALLPRQSCFSRKVAGAAVEEQIIAANVDFVCLVMALNRDFNPRRMERYLTAIYDSGAQPVIVLSKADLCEDPAAYVAQTQKIASGAEVIAVSALTDTGLTPLRALFLKGGQVRTAVFTGASGAGKSTLMNALLGDSAMRVQGVRADDDRGRHTTTHRQLLRLPSGGLLIDTPGMRELQLWGTDEGLSEAFDDIAQLSGQCRYRDCSHDQEPGCAVQSALESGALARARFANYAKMQRELAHVARKEDVQAQLAERKKWKSRTVEARKRGNRP